MRCAMATWPGRIRGAPRGWNGASPRRRRNRISPRRRSSRGRPTIIRSSGSRRMAEPVELREPFSDPAQQHRADMMGMYLFLASEIMLFGGLIAVALIVRLLHPAEMVEASKRLHLWI